MVLRNIGHTPFGCDRRPFDATCDHGERSNDATYSYIQGRRAKFPKRYATSCRSALRTCAMMQQGGSTESKMDQVNFLPGTDNGGPLRQMEPRKPTNTMHVMREPLFIRGWMAPCAAISVRILGVLLLAASPSAAQDAGGTAATAAEHCSGDNGGSNAPPGLFPHGVRPQRRCAPPNEA